MAVYPTQMNLTKPTPYRHLPSRVKVAGRVAGTPNKATVNKFKGFVGEGQTPLEYFLSILRAKAPEGADVLEIAALESAKFEAAKAAAPYCHPRLATTEVTGNPDKPIGVVSMSPLELARRVAFLLSGAKPPVSQP